MERAQMVQRAADMGIEIDGRWSDATLAAKIADAGEVIPNPVENPVDAATAHLPVEDQRPEPDDGRPRKKGRVLWSNVFSTEGKHLKGEEYDFLVDDFDALDAVDAIKGVS